MPIERKPEYFKGARLKVGIIGCGYVGLPLGLRFAEAGHSVVGFDTDNNKVEKLKRGRVTSGISLAIKFSSTSTQNISRPPLISRAWGKWTPSSSVCQHPWIRDASRIFPMLSRQRARSSQICSAVNWSCWSPQHIRAQPKSWCCQFWRRTGCVARSRMVLNLRGSSLISSWRFRLNAKIPETNSTGWRKFLK